MLTNWKTTLLGAATILSSLATILTDLAGGDVTDALKVVPVVLAGLIGIWAKDATK